MPLWDGRWASVEELWVLLESIIQQYGVRIGGGGWGFRREEGGGGGSSIMRAWSEKWWNQSYISALLYFFLSPSTPQFFSITHSTSMWIIVLKWLFLAPHVCTWYDEIDNIGEWHSGWTKDISAVTATESFPFESCASVCVCTCMPVSVCNTLPWHDQCGGWPPSCSVHHVL